MSVGLLDGILLGWLDVGSPVGISDGMEVGVIVGIDVG